MSSFNIVLGRPLFLLLMIPAAAVILIPFLRIPANRRRHWKKIVPVILRSIVCVLLTFCLAGVTLIMQTDSQSVIILMDLSDSTKASHEQIVAYTNDLMDQLKGKCGVVAFAGDSVYEVEFDSEDATARLTDVVAADTNIASAIEYAASLLPNDSNRRIILLSDGKETSGDAASSAFSLASQGYRIDAVYMAGSELGDSEIQISDIAMPGNIYAGDSIDIAVTVESNVSATAKLVLYNGDSRISETSVEVEEGSNSFFLRTEVPHAGVNAYRVELESASDALLSNNRMYSYVNAAGESSILVIADNPDRVGGLSAVLDPLCDLTVVQSEAAPYTIVDLCDYDEIILVNVNADELPEAFAGNLASYVSDFGRSVLTVGGSDTYMYGNMKGTVFEEMMPVDLILTDEENGSSTALMLVLDTSISIRRNLPLAKQGAIQCVNAMKKKDEIGLVSFNTYAYLEYPLVKAKDRNKEILNRVISRLSVSGGTHYTVALEFAHKQLLESTAETKHVIFLADGAPSDTGYNEAIAEMTRDGITVSTISVGYTSEILSEMARIGGGRYYDVQTVKDLPNIMLSETEKVSINSLLIGSFTPVIENASSLTAGLEGVTLPSLGGYLGVTIKETVDPVLVSEEGHPVYAVWNYGLGTVASFMSDLEGDWSSEWLSNETGRLLVERMMTTTIGDTHNESTMSAEFEQRGSKTSVFVDCLVPALNGTVSLDVTMPNGETSEYTLHEVNLGFYEGEIDTSVPGIYEMSFVEYDGEGNTVDYLDSALAVSYSSEYDAFGESGEGLLEYVCSYSGGTVADHPDTLVEVEMEKVEEIKDPLIPIALICAAFLLADLILRLLRMKDIKEFLRTGKSERLKKL